MTEPADQVHLAHIDQMLGRIEASGVAEQSLGTFAANTELVDATLRRLQTMAESTQKLSGELKAEHPDIPWREVSGFRDRLVHGYLSVDMEVVHETVRHDLPPLGKVVSSELELGQAQGPPRPELGQDLGW